jgi:hypothetical protein
MVPTKMTTTTFDTTNVFKHVGETLWVLEFFAIMMQSSQPTFGDICFERWGRNYHLLQHFTHKKMAK